MWNRKSIIEIGPGTSRQTNRDSSEFIQRMRESDRYVDILDDVFVGRTEENPHHKKKCYSVALCTDIKEEARQRFLEVKRRQHLRENNQELKQLEVQLRAAYVRKGVSAQIFEMEAIREEQKAKNQNDSASLELARCKRLEVEKKLEEEKRRKAAALKEEILDQIAISSAKRLTKYETILQEKKIMDEAVRKLEEDKRKERCKAADRKVQEKFEYDEYVRTEKERQIAQNQADQKEVERINKLLKQRDLEQQALERAKKENRLQKEQISDKLGQQLYAIEKEQAKGKECLVELLIDERKAKEEMQTRKMYEQQRIDRIAIHLQIEHDIEVKKRQKLEQQRLDEEFFEVEMRVLAERDKLQQLSDEKRRRKQMEHRKALHEALDEKKRLRAEQMKDHLRAKELELLEFEKTNRLIEEERGRMLQRHAPDLIGFLAPGVLRESDKQFLSILPKTKN